MKQTGMVRRIDNLGRIVIPKEIRKTLHIHDGELLELMIDDENIVLKKYSTIEDISKFLLKIVNVLESYLSANILITDLDHVLITNNKIKVQYSGKSISKSILNIVNNRQTYLSSGIEQMELVRGYFDDVCCYIIPLMISGDVIGSFIAFSNNKLDAEDIKLVDIACSFINKYIEE